LTFSEVNRRALEASKADLGAAEESTRGVLITVLAEVGLDYLDLRGLQKQLAVARDNLRLQDETVVLTHDRFTAGLASELDTTRAEAQAANTRSQIPLLEQDVQRSIHRLSVITGKEPTELESELAASAPIPAATPGIPVGLPSDLLRRRPDLRQAEREVAALRLASALPRGFVSALLPDGSRRIAKRERKRLFRWRQPLLVDRAEPALAGIYCWPHPPKYQNPECAPEPGLDSL